MKPEPGKTYTRPGFNFAFDPGACATCPAHCCRGTSGYVWVGDPRIEDMAAYLNLEKEVFIARFLRRVGQRFALQEREHEKDDFACVFLDVEHGQCRIYEARPGQCRTFPFWEHFREYPDEVDAECPGILHDDHFSS